MADSFELGEDLSSAAADSKLGAERPLSGAERRISPRCPSELPLRYRFVRVSADARQLGGRQLGARRGDGRWLNSWTQNVSCSGLRFPAAGAADFLSESLGPHAPRVEIELDLPGCGEVIRCLSKVAWARVAETGGAVDEIGVRFLDMTEAVQEQLLRFVQRRV